MHSTVLVSLLLVAGAPPSVDVARAQLKALKYAEAAKTLKQLASTQGLARADAIEFYLLDGLVKASLNDEDGARAAFTRALLIDPDVKLPGKAAPRVTTPFFEAKGAVREQGRLDLSVVQKTATATGWIVQLSAPKDELGLVAEVAFAIDEDGVARTVTLPFSKVGALELRGSKIRLSWKLYGAHRWVLQEGAPLELTPPPPPEPPPAPLASPPGPPAVDSATAATATAPPAQPSKVPGALVLGAGVAAAVVGGVFVGLSHADATAAQRATSIDDLESAVSRGSRNQTIGFVSLGVGAAAAVAGLVMLIIESSSSTSVAFAPVNGGGVAVFSGRWP